MFQTVYEGLEHNGGGHAHRRRPSLYSGTSDEVLHKVRVKTLLAFG